ncbi:MAG: Mut7-C RNAse domain-containing protein [Natrialbaceae archaeon]|nr:Mut7-C RNAse domain-containing protein [Natrialbaceae archaeon]
MCGRCNGSLEPVEDGTATPEYAPNPAREPLWQCTVCGQYFWKGSHWDDVRETLETARGQ